MLSLIIKIFAIVVLIYFVALLASLMSYIKNCLLAIKNHFMGVDTKDFVETAAERVLRITEFEYGKKHSVEETKKMTYAEGMLNDVMREAGFDVTRFNIKGLLQHKAHQIGMKW